MNLTTLLLLTPIAFVDVTVVPMDADRLLPAQTVVVEDGRITAVGPATEVVIPAGATRIDGRGRYLMPGLAEMHAHVPPQAHDRQYIEDTLFLYAANGITFARSMLGAAHHLELRERAERGEILSPRLYLSGPSLNGNSVPTPRAGEELVAAHAAAGYDFLKIHPGLDRPRYDAIVAAAARHDITLGGHVPDAVGLAHALHSGQATIDHLDGFMQALLPDGAPADAQFFGWNLADDIDEERIAPLARAVADAGAWVVPTESLMQHVLLPTDLTRRAELRYVPRALVAQWVQSKAGLQSGEAYDPALVARFIAVRAAVLRELHAAGAGLLLGSDAPQIFNVPGFAIHHELAMLVDAGLTPYTALASGTVNVARFIGEPEEFGTVAVGRRADLLLLEANPLADVAHVQRRAGVMLKGRWFPEAELQAGLAAIAARHR